MNSKLLSLISVPVAVLVFLTATPCPVLAQEAGRGSQEAIRNSVRTVESANAVLQDFVSSGKLPRSILRDSQAVVVMPRVIQAGFILGGRRGEGVMLMRRPDGSWSNPAFVTITGGSIGLQVGAKSSDIILAFQDQESIRRVYRDGVTFGGSVSGVAGPADADAVFPTDSRGNIYAYTRSEGLFGGVALAGIDLAFDENQSARFYGRDSITPRQIFTGRNLRVPRAVSELQLTLKQAVATR